MPLLDVPKLVFVDETAVYVSMNRKYGWSRRGEPAIIIDSPHGKRISIVAGIAHDGLRGRMTFEGTLNGPGMLEYIEHHLGPSLHPKDIVVLDNLSVHRMKVVRSAIEAFGATVLYLPPYSPELNPIEHTWSTLKAWLRAAWTGSLEELHSKIIELWPKLDGFCEGWVRNCGYITSH
jgi:transposase